MDGATNITTKLTCTLPVSNYHQFWKAIALDLLTFAICEQDVGQNLGCGHNVSNVFMNLSTL